MSTHDPATHDPATHDPETHDHGNPSRAGAPGTTTATSASSQEPVGDDRRDQAEVVRSEERLRVGTVREQAGSVRAVKHVDVEQVETRVDRGTEHAELDRTPVTDAEADSGEVETLPDGSISIPVFEEQIVITKRLVVRERVVLRKQTVYEEQVVSAELKRERLEVEAVGDAVVTDEGQARR